MAFDFKYMSIVDQQQNLDPTLNGPSAQVNGFGVRIFTYQGSATGANDTTAATQAADYFLPATGYLRNGDLIYVTSNNPGYHLLNVNVSNGVTVTTTQIV